jgi:uncharacterized protein (TIGR01244 family)
VQIVKINDRLGVSAQPNESDFPAIKAAGYASVINNRPEGEDAQQPGSSAEAEAARLAGLHYHHLPVKSDSISEQNVRSFQRLVDQGAGPTLAHCKSGTRSLTLWVLGETLDGRMREDEIVEFGRARGFDLTKADHWARRRKNDA